MRPRHVGRTVDVGTPCGARTSSGRGCSRRATVFLGHGDFCSQHAARYVAPDIAHCSVIPDPQGRLVILHFSDLHGNRKATDSALSMCRRSDENAVVMITGDVGVLAEPRLAPGWADIPQTERWAVPGNHDNDPEAVFGGVPDWTWQCPWIHVLGEYALVGFDSGTGSGEAISKAEIALALESLREVWQSRQKAALIVASHHKPGGVVQARLSTGLKRIISGGTFVVFVHGHEHGEGSWTSSRLGWLQAWYSHVISCDKRPVGHRIVLGDGPPRAEAI